MLRPRPVPPPASLVVNRGSNACSRTSGVMPWPVSVTVTGRTRSRAARHFGCLGSLACRCDAERAALGHGVARIEGEVQKRILQLGGVNPSLTAIIGERRFEPNLLGQGVA